MGDAHRTPVTDGPVNECPTPAESAGAPPTSELARQRKRVLVIASVGVFLAALDSSILAVAIPSISADLELSFSEALWIQAAYLLTVTMLLIPVGRWGERRGAYSVFWIGGLLFAVFSLMAGFSFDGVSLIAARVFQAVGGAMLLTTAAAIVTAIFPPQERGRALGLNMMGATIGQTLGPPLGGILVSHIGWQWIFLVKVPLLVLMLAAGWDLLGAEKRDRLTRVRPLTRADEAAGRERGAGSDGAPVIRMDFPGAALLGVFLAALFVPLIFSPLWGWGSLRTIGPLVAAAVFAVVFIRVESKAQDPIINLELFRRSRVFAAANTASILFMATAYGIMIFTAVFLEVVQGRSAQVNGLILLIQPCVMTVITPIAGRLSDRFGSRGLSTLGMLVAATGTLQLALFTVSTPVWQVLAGLGTVGLGLPIFSTPNFSAIMGSVDRSRLGVASGMFTTSRFFGMGVSISVLGAIAASNLGAEGGRVILLGARAGVENAQAFATGYREAMLVATGFALLGALVSLVKERRDATGGRDVSGRPAAPRG